MWRVNITCDDQAWKLSGVEFKKIAENYKGELIGGSNFSKSCGLILDNIELF